ncbi:HD domain-containing protein [Leifsonia sp. Leaf264]|uniref:HD domain-containing protein n=1 Tax=Leifsonia sp. Leaf264 TaxID=1736314 RepID=UPI0009E7EC3E|nr:HD domain-containing protein [Leifsonia sp. Leaf264]
MRSTPVDEMIRSLPLKQMDATLLSRELLLASEAAGNDVDLVEKAIAYASYLHRDQTRANRGDMPRVHYIEHPLRSALRLVRWGVTDQAAIIASILHDTVEDCVDDIVALSPVTKTSDPRHTALTFWATEFGTTVYRTVEAVTNPELPAGLTRAQKHDAYRTHVVEAIADPRVALVKFTDFVDNALSLHHTASHSANKDMVARLASKYEPLGDAFIARLFQPDVEAFVPFRGMQEITETLASGLARLRTQAAKTA